MSSITYTIPFLHFLFPHQCPGCGSDVVKKDKFLCWRCMQDLPYTRFASLANNPVEKIFWGRIRIHSAMSLLYFAKNSIVQNIIHQFKYQNQQGLGVFLGNLMGIGLLESDRFSQVDYLVPLPLFSQKEQMRGYNQSELLCKGIHEVIPIPILSGVVQRESPTESQTRKHRTERWQNVAAAFTVSNPSALENKHILLIDDVVTTGSTLEACGLEILQYKNIQLSVATLAIARQ